jgi:hypothetical protein
LVIFSFRHVKEKDLVAWAAKWLEVWRHASSDASVVDVLHILGAMVNWSSHGWNSIAPHAPSTETENWDICRGCDNYGEMKLLFVVEQAQNSSPRQIRLSASAASILPPHAPPNNQYVSIVVPQYRNKLCQTFNSNTSHLANIMIKDFTKPL